MGIWDKLTGELIDIIEWLDETRDTMVWRYPRYDNEIKNGAKLIVRESQACAFINEGTIADVFEFPGTYTLETKNLPILGKLKGWKYGFESPFKAEVYFVSTRTFTDRKWGTKNPIMMRDAEFGPVRLRAFGTFAVRVSQVGTLLKNVVGTNHRFSIDQIGEQLRDLMVARFADALGESKIPVLDMAANQDELGQVLLSRINPDFAHYGIEVTQLVVENISLPPEVEKALDKRTSMGVLGDLNKYMQYQSAEAIREAAKNPGGVAGVGAGLGAGMAMANQMGQAMQAPAQAAAQGSPAGPPPLPAQSVQFFAAIDNQQTGPFDLAAVSSQIQAGRITRQTLVWKHGMANWSAAESVSELQSLFRPRCRNDAEYPLPHPGGRIQRNSLDEPTSRPRQFPCARCGAMLEFDPGTTSLKCVYCGWENEIAPDAAATISELDLQEHLRQLNSHADVVEALLVRCQGCGAEQTFQPGVTAAECVFCGKAISAAAVSKRLIKPQSLLPFRITQQQAIDQFKTWIASRWFAPNELKRRANKQRIFGSYVPAWTFDSDTTSPYRGQRGENYYETQTYTTVENGKTVTRTRQVRKVRWYPASGTVLHFFNDVLVLATTSLPPGYGEDLEPWNLPNLVPFDERYLSGFIAEAYHVDLPQGWQKATAVMDNQIQRMIRTDIGGDHQRIDWYQTAHREMTFKHILLPVWISAYTYREKVYQFLVNGQTGEVQGQRPYSAIKITLFVLMIAAIVGTIAYFIAQS